MTKYLISNRKNDLIEILRKDFTSANINFLIGAGTSINLINPQITEQTLNATKENSTDEEFEEELKKFKIEILEHTSIYTDTKSDGKYDFTVKSYENLITNIANILNNNASNIQNKQFNIFTTNYDLLIEDAINKHPEINLNNGFSKTFSYKLQNQFDISNYFKSRFNTGFYYDYKSEDVSINLFKIHGSLNWERIDNEESIIFRKDISKITTNNLELILPTINKHQETTLTSCYYEQLRLFANQLDKKNTILFIIGTSLGDSHINSILKQAIVKNAMLKVYLIIYNKKALELFEKKDFLQNHSVNWIYNDSNNLNLDLNQFNEILSEIISVKKDKNEKSNG